MILGRYDHQGTGTRDNFLVVGGFNPSANQFYFCEVFNGTNWSEITDLPYKTCGAYGMGKPDDRLEVVKIMIVVVI